MRKKLVIHGATIAGVAVCIGALGAHGLKPYLSVEAQASFETGVRYQIYHAFFLLALAGLPFKNEKTIALIRKICVAGIVCFSGSIYCLVLDGPIGFELPKIFGLITPIGGVLLIVSWLLLVKAAIKEL